MFLIFPGRLLATELRGLRVRGDMVDEDTPLEDGSSPPVLGRGQPLGLQVRVRGLHGRFTWCSNFSDLF
jgi:hypothetical protein